MSCFSLKNLGIMYYHNQTCAQHLLKLLGIVLQLKGSLWVWKPGILSVICVVFRGVFMLMEMVESVLKSSRSTSQD